ncbi:hypothetical protein NE237_022904 [Protea cynaroides]|uniref:Uncharacterized protein n=1 Tax=Protea cynaroides TaxID=273540 RepID=A0A9Q0HE31_9MAGN|nr:hypothetical protein NE237_022904 [Protea cynaroides]
MVKLDTTIEDTVGEDTPLGELVAAYVSVEVNEVNRDATTMIAQVSIELEVQAFKFWANLRLRGVLREFACECISPEDIEAIWGLSDDACLSDDAFKEHVHTYNIGVRFLVIFHFTPRNKFRELQETIRGTMAQRDEVKWAMVAHKAKTEKTTAEHSHIVSDVLRQTE